jgi:catechol 2,3-dioxygenase-like lactoylglutathione lyase family enzyme
MRMINGAHFLLYSSDPDADRVFLRDVLGFRSVDAGHGWLIFVLPPAEIAVHPIDADAPFQNPDGQVVGASLYLMCDDLGSTMQSLESKNVLFSEVNEERWGIVTTCRLPSGGEIGLYQPTHPTALEIR